jgi:hypothetical protein
MHKFFEIPLAKDHSFWILFQPSKEVEEDPAFYGSACYVILIEREKWIEVFIMNFRHEQPKYIVSRPFTCFGASQAKGSNASKVTIQGDIDVAI